MRKGLEIFYNFLKQDKLKNIIIILQIIISVFAVTFLLVPIIKNVETMAIINNSNIGENTILFSSNFNLLISPKTYFNENYNIIKKFINNIDGVSETGTVYLASTNKNDFNLFLYDKLVCNTIKLQIQEGRWFEKSDLESNKIIPIIISDNMKSEYHVGSTIEIEMPEYKTEEMKKIKCIVIGILKRGTYMYYGSSNHTDPSVSDLFSKLHLKERIAIIPNILDFEAEYAAKDGIIINCDISKLNNIYDKINLSGIGKINTLNMLKQNDSKNVILYNESQIYQFLIVYIFIIMSIGGYTILTSLNYKRLLTIYYICGLTWQKGLKYIILKNILLILIPTILSSIFSNIIVCYFKTIYTFNIKVVIITVLLYMSIAALASVLTIINLKKYKPSEFLKEVD